MMCGGVALNKIIGVVGSRDFEDYELMKKVLDEISPDVIVSGGARGADRLGARYAKERGLKLLEFIPNWDLWGKRAGFMRNTQIVEASDMIVAFWDGKSNGTRDSINKAKKRNMLCKVVLF